MSPSAFITVRTTKSGKRYVVRYRIGGRYSKLVHAGSFRTQKDARERRDFVIAELAAGRNPTESLRALARVAPTRTYRQWAAAYKTSRIDLDERTQQNVASHLARLNDLFGDRDPFTLTVPEQIEAIAQLVTATDDRRALAPSTLGHYWATHRQILDFAGVKPNPARDPTVKLPKHRAEEPNPPTAKHFLALLEHVTDRKLPLPLVTMEQTAVTIGETIALEWGDVDVADRKFRLRRSTVKGGSCPHRRQAGTSAG